MDVTEPAEIEALFEHVEATFGRLDALVNNVAYTANESILDCDLETWEKTIDTNLRSYFLCTKHAAPLLAAGDGGAVVNVTVSSTRGLPEKFSYMTSKGGVTYLTRAAALDLIDDGIRVNAVGSGLIGTPVGFEEMHERPSEIDRIPAGHPGDPADVAGAVSYLVSDDAAYVVGAKLDVDGGLNASL
ncbi:SDR family NAD(P)-dependent oxidoreductase [Halarchaeum acidiphilum]|uniref:SDR family NAD(P)-dependent oxidoreductase n=1 Tax=Halarchaeum acidiphilum TaxID=489138 RepID=UPI00131ED903|nr:SDR family oxidoreductase [Halarchaeum acidiphilum]